MLVITGNCQARQISLTLGLMLPDTKIEIRPVDKSFSDLGAGDTLLVQSPYLAQCTRSVSPKARVLVWPSVVFGGYHPDIVVIPGVASPIGGWNSSIAMAAFKQGLSEADALALFRPDVFEALGFYSRHAIETKTLSRWLGDIGYPAERTVDRWIASGTFMHGINHTKMNVALDVTRHIADQLGATFNEELARRYSIDMMVLSGSWPVYPGVSEHLGLGEGDFQFKAVSVSPTSLGKVHDLQGMVAESYKIFQGLPAKKLIHVRLDQPQYQNLRAMVQRKTKIPVQKASPYVGLPDYQFWKRAVAQPAMGDVDPVLHAKFTISQTDRVATAGSCFAQHIARTLERSGFNYYVAENGPAGMTKDVAEARQFGLFSARFGNLYTVRQLVQLFDRAHGAFRPENRVWQTTAGKHVDPFRPTVEPGGFAGEEELAADRANHFAAVREMFSKLDVFVFTLGLTEGWRAKKDGAVLPLAPGVSGGIYDPEAYEFVNFSVEDVKADLEAFWTRLRGVNPRAKMILTVSPVPLIATYEPRHVLVSTAYSKAVLRAAVEDICQKEPNVAYFPSFEIITGNHAGNSYFESDLRSVREEGVAHVMKLFLRHYAGGTAREANLPLAATTRATTRANETRADNAIDAEAEMNARIICDEERISQV